MKIAITLFVLIGWTSFGVHSQVFFTHIDENNAKGKITDVGEFFTDPAGGHGYEVPKGSGKHVLYSASMWFGGKDENGQLKLAAPMYSSFNPDFWPGALTVGNAISPVPNPLAQTLWVVHQDEIEDHILNYASPGYTPPSSIVNWPAHGDTSIVPNGQDFYLAPFVDTDGDGVYAPEMGDYPCIKGDKAVYTIVNDKGGMHGTGGQSLGIEVHFMFYQYSSVSGLEDVTFIDTKVINRSADTLYEFITSFFADTDIGNYFDDFAGCDSLRNIAFAYNGDAFDEMQGGVLGYEMTPPAAGVKCLTHSINTMGVLANLGVFPHVDPSTPSEFYHLMSGKYIDGSPWLDNNGSPTSFQYPGNPNNSLEWSEEASLNFPGDRRIILSVEKPDAFAPSETISLSYAVIFGQDTNRLESVSRLYEKADEVQAFFDNEQVSPCASSLNISKSQQVDFVVYPNPSNGVFTLSGNFVHAHVEVTSLSGEQVWYDYLPYSDSVTIDLKAKPGVYLVTVETEQASRTKKVIIE